MTVWSILTCELSQSLTNSQSYGPYDSAKKCFITCELFYRFVMKSVDSNPAASVDANVTLWPIQSGDYIPIYSIFYCLFFIY
jgi:hypothetical protein